MRNSPVLFDLKKVQMRAVESAVGMVNRILSSVGNDIHPNLQSALGTG
jgi:hypothetical protein